MIMVLSIIIALVGMVLTMMLFWRIKLLNMALKLKRFRSKEAGLADLLNYAAVVDDGVIVGKNGSFIAAWLYKGDDVASSLDEQREMVSFRINQAFAGLGSGWMVHIDAVRRPADPYSAAHLSHFPDRVSRAIDEERRRLFESLGAMFEGYFVITLTWFPPFLVQRKFINLMFDDDSEVPATRQTNTINLIDQFKREIKSIENRLSTVLDLTRLRAHKMRNKHGHMFVNDDLLSWLQFCITGKHHAFQLPKNPVYLDSYLGGEELWGGVIPKIGRKFIQVVAIEGFPFESYPGILASLADMGLEYRWSSRFIFMDEYQAVKHMDKFRKKWRQKIRGFFDQVFNTSTGPVNYDALSMVEDAEAAIAEINSGLVAAGYYTSCIILMNEDRQKLEQSALQVEKAINMLGFVARIETINTMDAFFGSLPGHGVENVRRPLLNTLNFADLIPTSSIWTGNPKAPCPFYPPSSPALMHCVTDGSTPFRLNLHVRDVGHTFMFGPTGAGKSTHLAIIAAQLRRYKNMSIYVFDKGMSMYPLTKAVGGLHFTVASDDDELAFCPLQFLETKSDRAWALEWIDTLLALNGLITTPQQRNDIDTALLSMHNSGAKTLSEFSITIQNKAIREALKQYTIDGAMGHLLDAEEDNLSLSQFVTFEIEDLMNLGDKFALPVLLYLFRRIERSLQGDPCVIILDEAWLMLGHAVFREKIREWLKVLRKQNCLVLMATQSLSDAANSGILDVIIESTATKIFLPNLHAMEDETAALYSRIGLNKQQISMISKAIPKQQYYYVSENGRRLYDLALGDLALAFVASSDKDSIAHIKQLEKQYGEKWIDEWLELRGINLNDYA